MAAVKEHFGKVDILINNARLAFSERTMKIVCYLNGLHLEK